MKMLSLLDPGGQHRFVSKKDDPVHVVTLDSADVIPAEGRIWIMCMYWLLAAGVEQVRVEYGDDEAGEGPAADEIPYFLRYFGSEVSPGRAS